MAVCKTVAFGYEGSNPFSLIHNGNQIINNKLNIIIDIKGGYSVNGSGADCKSVAYGSVGSSPTPLI